MKRRIRVLGVGAAVLLAACGRSEDEAGTIPLQHDAALATVVLAEPGSSTHTFFAGPGAKCAATAQPAPVSATRAERAAELVRNAQDASLLGDGDRSHALLSQAARLDPRNADVAYNLGTLHETRGEAAAATREYCRYLALSPSAPNADEVGSRLIALSPSRPVTATRPTVAAATPRAQPRPSTSRPRRVSRPAPPVYPTASVQTPAAPGASAPTATVASQPSAPVYQPTSTATPTTDVQPQPQPEPRRRRTQEGAIIGAVAGGALGAIIGRDVKGAIIGAAAGGILGGVVGHARTTVPVSHGSYR